MSIRIERAAAMRNAFDMIEESYEFMLAYAAQGHRTERSEGGGESRIRQYLKRFAAALNDLESLVSGGLGGPESVAFSERFNQDIAVARSVIEILLSKPSISSDMIDNTNGLLAVRAFLTDLFFVDQAMLPKR